MRVIKELEMKTCGLYVAKMSAKRAAKWRDLAMSVELDHKPSIGKLYGKEVFQPRDVTFFSDESKGYWYSRKLAKSKPLHRWMKDIIKWVNKKFSTSYNGVLINRYYTKKDGTRKDSIGKHSDNERDLDPVGVVGIAFGAACVFRIRKKTGDKKINGKNFLDVKLSDSDVFVMSGNFQTHYTHEIPVMSARSIKNDIANGDNGETFIRTSLTFRKHLK